MYNAIVSNVIPKTQSHTFYPQNRLQIPRFRGQNSLEPEPGNGDNEHAQGIMEQLLGNALLERIQQAKRVGLEVHPVGPEHPYAAFKGQEAKEIQASFTRKWAPHIILVNDDEALREGTLSALSSQLPDKSVFRFSVRAIPEEHLLQAIAQVVSEISIQKQQQDGSRPSTLVLVLDDPSIQVQEILTNAKKFTPLATAFPFLRVILNIDPTRDEDNQPKKTRSMLEKLLRQTEMEKQRSYRSQQGQFNLFRIKPLSSEQWSQIFGYDEQCQRILGDWHVQFPEKSQKILIKALETHIGLNIDNLYNTVDSIGQFIDDYRQKRTQNGYSIEYPTIVTTALINRFVKEVIQRGFMTYRESQRSALGEVLKPYEWGQDKSRPKKIKTQKSERNEASNNLTSENPIDVKPYAQLRLTDAKRVTDILLGRHRIKHVQLESPFPELIQSVLDDVYKLTAGKATIFRLDAKKAAEHGDDWLKILPKSLSRVKYSSVKSNDKLKQPVIIILDNISNHQRQAFSSKLFEEFQTQNPDIRFVLTSPAKPEPVFRNPFFRDIFNSQNNEESGKNWFKGFFEVIPLKTMQLADWKQWVNQDAEAQTLLNSWHLKFSKDGLDTFLATLEREAGEEGLSKELLLAELDALGGFLQGEKLQKTVKKPKIKHIQREQVQAYTREVIRKRDTDTKKKTGGFDAEPFTVLRPGQIRIRFKDVIGHEAAKKVFKEALDAVRYPNLYAHLNRDDEDGNRHFVLLKGSAGTGKTRLAKALAGEANAKFISTSGSQFVNVFVGMGANNMRKVFDAVEDNTIIYIDEADAALASRTNNAFEGGNSEDHKTVDQFLACTEGIGQDERKIIVVLSTNHPEKLDQAVLDRCHYKIDILPPTSVEREEHFKMQLANKQLRSVVPLDYKKLAALTRDISGREIRNIVKQVKDTAISRLAPEEKDRLERSPKLLKNFALQITQADLEEAIQMVLTGKNQPEKLYGFSSQRIKKKQ